MCDATGSLEVLVDKSSRAALRLLKAVNVFLGVRVPNSAGVLHDGSKKCGVALGCSVSWASSHVSLEKWTYGICFAGCAVDVLLPAKLIVQLHA